MRPLSLVAVSLVSLLASLVGPGCATDECEDDEACHADETSLFEQAYEEGQEEGKADGTDCSGVRVPDRSGFQKRIALTFDDGPNPATTPRVIEILERHRAPATFFINGARLAAPGATQIAQRIADHPDFLLANHSQNHLDLAAQTPAKVAQDIDRTDAAIRATGEVPRYFRFPFGSSSCSSMQQVRARGLIATGWHIDSADWCFAAGKGMCRKETFRYVPDDLRHDMAAYVMSQLRTTNGGILLFHDVHAATADALDELLTRLEAAGYTFVRLDDETVFPKLHGVAAPPQKFIGDRCSTNADCGFVAGGALGRCHPAGFCTTSCQGTCPDLAGRASTFCIADTAGTSPGICVSKAAAQNAQCAALPGTVAELRDRFLGTSSASPASALVCAPR